MDFSDILVIKLIPLAVDHILAISYVMPTWNRGSTALMGFGVHTAVRPGLMSATQTELAVGREQTEGQRRPNSCSAKL